MQFEKPLELDAHVFENQNNKCNAGFLLQSISFKPSILDHWSDIIRMYFITTNHL